MSEKKAEASKIGKMFNFSNVDYPNQMRIRTNRQKYAPSQNLMLYACYAASLLWAGLIIAYGVGIMSAYPAASLPLFLPVSIILITIFPIVMIWAGYIVYTHILKAQETGTAILEAARILGSPALVAASDVETLSSSVAGELSNLRHALRDIEERIQQSSKVLSEEVGTLNDASEHLERTVENVSGKIFRERDSIIDMIKLLKHEKQPQILPEPMATRQIKMNNIHTDHPAQTPLAKEVSEKIENMIHDTSAAQAPSLQPDLQEEKQEEEPKEEEPKEEDIKRPVSFSMSDIQPLSETPENFILRNERQLFEGLYAITVDMNRLFDTGAPQELWPRYMRGERNVFAEFFCDWTRKNYDTYRKLSTEEEFRKLSSRFIAQFETLRERLFDTPHMEVSEYLERSGVGRVYNLLSAEYI